MKLKKYLQISKLTQEEFSLLTGLARITITQYVNGKRTPVKQNMQKIHEITKGMVSYGDWYKEEVSGQGLSIQDILARDIKLHKIPYKTILNELIKKTGREISYSALSQKIKKKKLGIVEQKIIIDILKRIKAV